MSLHSPPWKTHLRAARLADADGLSSASVLALLLLLLAILSGCAESGPQRFAVSGNVTFAGEPVAQGTIGLTPVTSGESAVGGDIVAGKFAIAADQGPTAGKYRVWIEAERPSGRKIQADEGSTERIDEMVQYIPHVYNLDTTLEAEITGNRIDLDFALEPQKGRRR